MSDSHASPSARWRLALIPLVSVAGLMCHDPDWQGTYTGGEGDARYTAILSGGAPDLMLDHYARVEAGCELSVTSCAAAQEGPLHGFLASGCATQADPPGCGPTDPIDIEGTLSADDGSMVTIMEVSDGWMSVGAPPVLLTRFTACGQDSDGDRLDDCVETNTGTFVDEYDTGTDPFDADTDGDGLPDGDEVEGTLAGLDLPALGVSPVHKDLLIEYDWFDDALECGAHSHRPTAAMLARVAASFAAAPVPNPDGVDGIKMIQDIGQGGVLDGGNLVADADGVLSNGVNSAEFLGMKAANFATNRRGYFHYAVLPHRYNTSSSSSGQAELPGNDLIVSLYCAVSTVNVANTIMHELGHNLNLFHGGDDSCNYKPNYNSVMNYRYQFPGVDSNCTPAGDGVLDYSIGSRIDLDETSLDETQGTCGTPSYDWNGNSTIESGVAFDINSQDGSENITCGGTLTVLRDHDDWGNVQLAQVGFGDGASPVAPEIVDCTNVPPEAR